MLREASLEEYNKAGAIPHVERKVIPSGRVLSVYLTLKGVEIANKVEYYRAKNSKKPYSTVYMIDPDYLNGSKVKHRIRFSVEYETFIECDPDAVSDAISEIDIPENASCKYIPQTFEVLSTQPPIPKSDE